MSELIQSKIDLVRRKHAVTRAGLGAGTMGVVAVSVISATMLIDWWVELPYLLRCAMLALHVAALVYLLFVHVIWPLVKGPDDETVALWIEGFYEDASSRLISAVQFSRPKLALEGMSRQMLGAAVAEAEAYIEPKDTSEVIAVDQMVKRISVALLLLVVFAGIFLYGRGTTRDLFLRAIAVPGIEVPRKTQVDLLTPVKRVVAKGDSITIQAAARGVVPDEGTIRVRYAGGTTSDYDMTKDRDEPQRFAIEIQNVQDSFSYRVYLNDGRSVEATIDAHPRPDVTDVGVIQHLPAYTQLPPVPRSKSDLQLLAGSRLQLRVTANKPLADTVALAGPRNRVKFDGTKLEYFLKRDPNDPRVLVTSERNSPSIPLPNDATGMSIHLVDELGLESRDPAVYRITVVPDQPPTVNLTFPTIREELVTERASTTIGFDINDDIAVAKAGVRWMLIGAGTTIEGDGLRGQYYRNAELSDDPTLERIDAKIDFNFATKSPDPKLPADNFSVRWSGKLLPPQTGTYILQFATDDGVRVWIGEEQIVDAWGNRSEEVRSQPVELEAGKLVDIRIEYQELTGDARCQMSWVGPDRRREIIPQRSLFSSDEAVRSARLKQTKLIDLDIGNGQKSVRGQFKWELSQLTLQPGDVIEWWVEAQDNNDQTGPGRTESEKRSIRIGTEAQVREYLLQRLGNPLQAIEEIQDGQVELTTSLGQIIQEKPRTDPEPERQRP
jgi:hypothetical protein